MVEGGEDVDVTEVEGLRRKMLVKHQPAVVGRWNEADEEIARAVKDADNIGRHGAAEADGEVDAECTLSIQITRERLKLRTVVGIGRDLRSAPDFRYYGGQQRDVSRWPTG